MVSDLAGDVEPDPDQVLGLFYRDMRHLSRWQLGVDGRALDILSIDASGYPSATFFLAGPGTNVYNNPTLSVIRNRTLAEGTTEDVHEQLIVMNHGREDLIVELTLTFDADFADLFEVKDEQLSKAGTVSRRVLRDHVELIYRREDFERKTIIHADGAALTQGSAAFRLQLAPDDAWTSVVYPTACSPQAWVVGTPLLLLRVLLGLEPEGGYLRSDPHVPDELGRASASPACPVGGGEPIAPQVQAANTKALDR